MNKARIMSLRNNFGIMFYTSKTYTVMTDILKQNIHSSTGNLNVIKQFNDVVNLI